MFSTSGVTKMFLGAETFLPFVSLSFFIKSLATIFKIFSRWVLLCDSFNLVTRESQNHVPEVGFLGEAYSIKKKINKKITDY